jgi:hypothetical protein
MKTLGKRVRALEGRQRPVGCPTCQYWTWTIVVTVDEAGTETGRSRPGQCPACGRVVVVRHILQIVGLTWDEELYGRTAAARRAAAGAVCLSRTDPDRLVEG